MGQARKASCANVSQVGEMEIELAARMVRKAGTEVHLASDEYAGLAELAHHPPARSSPIPTAAHRLDRQELAQLGQLGLPFPIGPGIGS